MAPHAIADERRRSSGTNTNPQTPKYKFEELSHNPYPSIDESDDEESQNRVPSPVSALNGVPAKLHSSERWPGRKDTNLNKWSNWANGAMNGIRPQKQKSLSEAIKTVRSRRMSTSETAHEIAESLKAPVSFKLVVLCGLWYGTSLLTNTSSKSILTAFPRPVTLTVIQFFLVSSWCLVLSAIAARHKPLRDAVPVLKNGIRPPSRDIIMATLPLMGFQVGGHILSSDAMSRIPVSLVHTIKGLSPLMTVVAYRIFFDIRYTIPTYLSLVPLTLGVVMACSTSFKGNLIGLTCAFGSAILFVTQNIVSKKIFNEAAKAEMDGTPVGRRKPDKLNLLYYSSGMAFLFTLPIWFWAEGTGIIRDYYQDGSIDLVQRPGSLDHGRLALEFIFNGTFHFGQSLIAFVLLGMVSPVTYSVASLIKRVFVIMFAIVWFGNKMSTIQGFGFGLTFLGLYLYDRTSDAAKADKRARELTDTSTTLLPSNLGDTKRNDGPKTQQQSSLSPMNGTHYTANGSTNGHVDGESKVRSRASSPAPNGSSMLPGTRAEETWQKGDATRNLRQNVR